MKNSNIVQFIKGVNRIEAHRPIAVIDLAVLFGMSTDDIEDFLDNHRSELDYNVRGLRLIQMKESDTHQDILFMDFKKFAIVVAHPLDPRLKAISNR